METTEMTDTLKSINTTPHLCRSKVKQTALEIAAAIRPANKFSRVGMSFVERIEAKVRAATQDTAQQAIYVQSIEIQYIFLWNVQVCKPSSNICIQIPRYKIHFQFAFCLIFTELAEVQ